MTEEELLENMEKIRQYYDPRMSQEAIKRAESQIRILWSQQQRKRDAVGELEEERDRLRRENAKLRSTNQILNIGLREAEARIREMRARRGGSSMIAELTKLVRRFHPDRNPNGLDANAVVAELNRLRDEA